jgi:hypothetical protein
MGADRKVHGADFPESLGIMKPVEYVEAILGVPQRQRDLILFVSPARMLKL